METYDTGSIPFKGDWERYLRGARPVDQLVGLLYPSRLDDEKVYFEEKAVEGFLSKVETGIDIPNYPQFRDMNQMFLENLTGIERTSKGYVETGTVRVKPGRLKITEVAALKEHEDQIYEKTGSPFRLKVCVTGPYTLAATMTDRTTETFGDLAEAIAMIAEANIFHGKKGGVELLLVEEPSFGLVDDPLLDFGQEGREMLLKAWEKVFEAVRGKGVHSGFHLHSTRDELFWDAASSEIIESHVNDPFYESTQTREKLERKDKFIKAAIAVTDFDALVRRKLAHETLDENLLNEKVGGVWTGIRKGSTDPMQFVESLNTIRKRLRNVVSMFGEERVLYAGPECGLRSFPNPESALELLRRVSKAVET